MARQLEYQKNGIRIHTNHCDEIFIEDVQSGIQMRFQSLPIRGGGLAFTVNGRLDPVRVTNMIGWEVTRR